jgi:hypothetical protein
MNASALRSLAVALCLGSPAGLAAVSTGDETLSEHHVTRSTSGFAAEREADGPRDPATLEELKLAPDEVVRQAKPPSAAASFFLGEAWIYEVRVELFNDFDRDGYYTYMRVRIDADTIFNRHWVYAVLLLSADGLHWEELHITEDFLIRGTSPRDAYEIEVELVSGYPRGFYDVLVELYDSERALLLDEFGPAQSSALALLPLEDVYSDGFVPPV